MKFEKEVSNQINLRRNAILILEVQRKMLNREYQLYVQEELQKLGLDPKEKYDIDTNTGIIKRIITEDIEKGDSNDKDSR